MERNKLFVFGASYGGTLSALFRRKFPHLTVAAVALSAPMIREYVDKGATMFVEICSLPN